MERYNHTLVDIPSKEMLVVIGGQQKDHEPSDAILFISTEVCPSSLQS